MREESVEHGAIFVGLRPATQGEIAELQLKGSDEFRFCDPIVLGIFPRLEVRLGTTHAVKIDYLDTFQIQLNGGLGI